MAQPTEMHHEHYVERDTGSGAGVWAVVAVLIVLLALLLFGSNLFGSRNGTGSGTNVDVNGTLNTARQAAPAQVPPSNANKKSPRRAIFI